MRTFDIIIGIVTLIASVGLIALFFVNEWYALIAFVLFGICRYIYLKWKRHQFAREQTEAAAWHKKV